MMETQKQENKFEFDEASKQWLKGVLKEAVVTITFTKKDGTKRVMKCTLSKDVVPVTEEKETSRKQNEEALSVWDVEAPGWRAFRWDSVNSVSFTLGG